MQRKGEGYLPLPFPLPFPLPLFARAAFDASCTAAGTAPVEPESGLFKAGFGCGTVALAFELWSLEPDDGPSCFFACPGGSDGGVVAAAGAGVVATGVVSVTGAGAGATGTVAEPLSCFFA